VISKLSLNNIGMIKISRIGYGEHSHAEGNRYIYSFCAGQAKPICIGIIQ